MEPYCWSMEPAYIDVELDNRSIITFPVPKTEPQSPDQPPPGAVSSEILQLARWLEDHDYFQSPKHVIDYFGKPWNYGHERQHMLAASGGEKPARWVNCSLCEEEE